MNKSIRKLFGGMFQSQQTQPVTRIQQQHLLTSPEEWCQYWQAKGLQWRTEPEIDAKRQEELSKHRIIAPDIEKGIYPFVGMKLSRADVEWLLATHENGCGPIDWGDESQRERRGLDLRGADLCDVDLSNLPLAQLCGGLTWLEQQNATEAQCDMAAVLMNDTELAFAHLEKAILGGAYLDGAKFFMANLEEGYLGYAHLNQANFQRAHLEDTNLNGAHMKRAKFYEAQLQRAKLIGADLEKANLFSANMEEAALSDANLDGAQLGMEAEDDDFEGIFEDSSVGIQGSATGFGAHLERAILFRASLRGSSLTGVHLQGASLGDAHLEGACLRRAHLEGAFLGGVYLEGTDLREAHLEKAELTGTTLENKKHIGPRLADSQWSDVNLTVMKWSRVKILGDEYEAWQESQKGKLKGRKKRLNEYEAAVRANRQLALALEEQGLNEDANRFAYRAQILHRKLLWKQRSFWKWFGSAMLALLAGYGYRMWHILVAYLFIILVCAGAYFVLGMYYEPHLSFLDALLTSITAFHGRVFSEPFLHTGTPQLWVTAFEAVMGLVIEGVFIAMLTQKFFGK